MIIGGLVMKKKRLIAMIISAIMVFSMIPMAVFAAADSAITTTLPTEAKVGEQVEFGVTSFMLVVLQQQTQNITKLEDQLRVNGCH